jgi:hypothetical protein
MRRVKITQTANRPECAVCGRTQTVLAHWSDSETGISFWSCWRPSHRVMGAAVSETYEAARLLASVGIL